jgi:hypothetical protein
VEDKRSRSPDRFLAIAAAANQLKLGIDAEEYPIGSWKDLERAVTTAAEVEVYGPNGLRLSSSDVTAALPLIASRIGDGFFPIEDSDDFAHKAGQALVLLVLSHYRDHSVRPAELGTSAAIEEARKTFRFSAREGDNT